MSIIKDLFNFDQVSDSIIGGKDIGEHDKSLKLGNHEFLFVIKELRNEMFFRLFLLSGKNCYYAECESDDMFIDTRVTALFFLSLTKREYNVLLLESWHVCRQW